MENIRKIRTGSHKECIDCKILLPNDGEHFQKYKGGVPLSERCLSCLDIFKKKNKFRSEHRKAFNSWRCMLNRCLNPKAADYSRYGGRDILVHELWAESFENFYKDMGDRPEGLSLDRIDVNGNSEPENCRWASLEEQGNNKRTSVFLSFRGKTQTVSQWSKELKIESNTIFLRIKNGWTVEKTLTEPSMPRDKRILIALSKRENFLFSDTSSILENDLNTLLNSKINLDKSKQRPAKKVREIKNPITAFGKTQSLFAWSNEVLLSRGCIKLRIDSGMSPEEALTKPRMSMAERGAIGKESQRKARNKQ